MKSKRTDNCVIAGSIGIGETVTVMTLMGNHVVRGDVVGSTPFGVSIRESGGDSTRFYREGLHLFQVDEPEQVNVYLKKLEDMTPDERVQYKLSMLEASNDFGKKDKVEDPKEKEASSEPVAEPKKKEMTDDPKKKNDNNDKEIGKDKDVDVDKLPDDIKNAIISAEDLNGERLNGVIGDIGDAAMKALRRAGLKEDGIYDIVSEIQKSVIAIVLKGKEAKNVGK